jgi:cobalt-zinc-cadmium efflux system outer membrane protein
MVKLLFCLAIFVAVSAHAQGLKSAPAVLEADQANGHGSPIVIPLTLSAAIAKALQSNSEIAAATQEVEANEGLIRQAGLTPNPVLETLVEDQKKATRTTTLQINQAIELGGKRGARVTAAERTRDLAALDLIDKKAEVRAAVIAAFYDVVIAQERYLLAEKSNALAKRATLIASRRVTAGKISPVEETRAQIAESGIRIEFAQATNDLESARRQLATTWGSLDLELVIAESQMEELPSVPSLNELILRLQHSPALLRAHTEVDRRHAMAQVERSRRVPDITVSVGAQRDEQQGRNYGVLGVSIPIPLFDRNQGNILDALRRTDKARDELAATEINLKTELRQTYGKLATARKEVELLRTEILPGAQRNYEATTKGFELGKFSFLEVLDAQRTFFAAKSQHLRSLSEMHRSAASIERLLGETTYAPNN